MTTKKKYGREYTPDYIINDMLKQSGYGNSCVLDKHIIDNSCGNGAILRQIVDIYCTSALKAGLSKETIAENLAVYIHGIEIDVNECDKCIRKLDMTARKYGISDVKWDIRCCDTLKTSAFNSKMDYVIGNPPYIRIHNLSDNFDKSQYRFTQNGTTDMYIAFFEAGLNMLNNNGILVYITPNSYFTSLAGKEMRQYFTENRLLDKIVDFRHYQVFKASVYSAITVLNKNKSDNTAEYYRFDEAAKESRLVRALKYNEFNSQKGFVFEKPCISLNTISNNGISVKNGYATLCDKVFINKFSFRSEHIIPVVKASKGTLSQIIYPYDNKGNPLSEEDIQADTELYGYLLKNSNDLTNRDIRSDTPWYSYGRTQAINDTYSDKLAISPYIRNGEVKTVKAPAGTGVYGGLYITSDKIGFDDIIRQLNSDEFYEYISCVGKMKSGGYYTFSSKDVKTYLDCKFC